jgi:hypothetical protein
MQASRGRIPITEADTRIRLEAALASRNPAVVGVAEQIWEYLSTDGKVARVVAGEESIEWLAGEVLRLTALAQPGEAQRTEVRLPEGGNDRQRALSIILANEASKDPAVREFRTRVLKGRLLGSRQAAAKWIWDQTDRDGPSTAFLTDIPVPPGYVLRRDSETGHVVTDPPLKVEGAAGARGIRYRAISDDFTTYEAVYTCVTGIAEQLRKLSQDLAARYRWKMDDATVFVLTDVTPEVAPIRARAEISRTFPVCSRAILEVDPTLPPSEVARAYLAIRRTLWPRRIRTLSSKHASLAAFIEERSADETTWRQRLSEWNRKNPDPKYQYRSESNFRRDALTARRRLLTPSTWADNAGSGIPPLADWENADDMLLPVTGKRKQTSSKPKVRRGKKRR